MGTTAEIINTGTPWMGKSEDAHTTFAREMLAMTPVCAGIRRYGSAALDLAWVAAGRFDGFWERGLKPWDVAAGIVLVREAGGIVREIEGGDVMKTGSILAGNEDVVPQVQEQLRVAGAFGRQANLT